MVVLVLIDDEGYLGRSFGTFLLELRLLYGGIVAENTSNHLWTRLRPLSIKSQEARHEAGLVERKITVCRSETPVDLLRVEYVQSVHETIVGVYVLLSPVPQLRIVVRFTA